MTHRKRNTGMNQSRGSKAKGAFSVKWLCKGDRGWGGKSGIPANTRALLRASLRREITEALT